MRGVACRRPPLARPISRSIRLAVVARASKNGDNSLFIFGLGYTGLGAANYFQHRNWHVSGTCRTEEKTETLRSHGFEAYTFHTNGYEQLSRPALAALERATHVLSTVPPDGDSDPVLMAHSRELVASGEHLQWVGYISSTSVYGDHGSEWVDEESELLAAHGKGLSRMLSEGSWVALCYEYGVPVHVFRCGGIYGPRRSALNAVQKEGPPSASQERRGRQRFTARCHVEDICKVLEASTIRPRPGAVYNVVDDEPAGRGAVMDYAANLLACEMAALLHEVPKSADEQAPGLQSFMSMDDFPMSSGMSSSSSSGSDREEEERKKFNRRNMRLASERGRYVVTRAQVREYLPKIAPTPNGEKRVKNDLIKNELGVELEFPTYREGLSAIAKGDMRPFKHLKGI